MKKWFLMLGIMAMGIAISCEKTEDNLNVSGLNPDNSSLIAPDFVWKAMNLWYFWQADIPDLADDRFGSDQEYTEFLQANSDPSGLFADLQFPEDRFSRIYPDYRDLFDFGSGTAPLSNGLVFALGTTDGTNVFGAVEYIIPDSNASSANIQRGDFFIGVDGQPLTVDNYIELLFGSNTTYTLQKADYNPQTQTFSPNGNEVTLTKIENQIVNPIVYHAILDVGNTRVGYLMYTNFTADFEDALNGIFAEFQAGGVTELIVDLRYNGGGRVSAAVGMASMIFSDNPNQLFVRERFNPKIQQAFQGNRNFTDQTNTGSPINSLNLSRLFVLTSDETASASELLINGLTPFMEVVQIGEVTVGKNESALILVDDPESAFQYSPDREDQINPDNSWAIVPLIGRVENVEGFSDYTDGLVPDIAASESILSLSPLGSPLDPLLAVALSQLDPAAKAALPADGPTIHPIDGSRQRETPQLMLMESADYNLADTPLNGMK